MAQFEFKDRVSQYPGRRRLKVVSGSIESGELIVDVERNEGTVSVAGTPLNAINLNRIVENGVKIASPSKYFNLRTAYSLGVALENGKKYRIKTNNEKLDIIIKFDASDTSNTASYSDPYMDLVNREHITIERGSYQVYLYNNGGVTYLNIRSYSGERASFGESYSFENFNETSGSIYIESVWLMNE